MKRIKKFVPIYILSLFVFLILISSGCDEYKSEEFEISDLDLKACQLLQRPDSLGFDQIDALSLLAFDVKIPIDTTILVDTVLVDTTINYGWHESIIYNENTNKYKSQYVTVIFDSLAEQNLLITNTEAQKVKIIPDSISREEGTFYLLLQTNSASLTLFFDVSISVNIINEDGEIVKVSDYTMPLETASGCTKNIGTEISPIEAPFIQARYKISVPSANNLLQLILNEQTWPIGAKKEINVAIL